MNIFATEKYRDRLGRNQYAHSLINEHFNSAHSILNVGGSGENHLSALMPDKTVTSIDIDPEADIQFDLDSDQPLPIGEKHPDLVIALDVLEHLEKFHQRLDEILDIASLGAIVSLPISSAETTRILFRPHIYKRQKDTESSFSKYYGLPLQRPIDRHRWYIYGSDIINLAAALERKGYEVYLGFDTIFTSKLLSNLMIKLFGDFTLPNIISKWAWLIVKKPSISSE